MKIDIYCHIAPSKFIQALNEIAPPNFYQKDALKHTIALYDLDLRFRIMDKCGDLLQVLIPSSPIEAIVDSKKAVDLAKIANDSIAELVLKYPDRFVAGVACLPMNNIDAALNEADRAMNDLRFRGVQIWTPTNGKPIDLPEFMPLYQKMSEYNLPIWLHPMRPATHADYSMEKTSMYSIFAVFGWPYETAAAMTRLIFSGVLERFPSLKLITHHCGALVPYFKERITGHYDMMEMQRRVTYGQGLTKAPIEYFKMFYNDTAIYGNTPGLMCAYAFFGADKLLFGTDMPFGSQFGERYTRQTIHSIEQMNISDSEKKKIFEDNARKLLRLPL